MEQVEADRREALRALMGEPTGPWAYLAERTEQVRELREQYLERQRAAEQQASAWSSDWRPPTTSSREPNK